MLEPDLGQGQKELEREQISRPMRRVLDGFIELGPSPVERSDVSGLQRN